VGEKKWRRPGSPPYWIEHAAEHVGGLLVASLGGFVEAAHALLG
jgi:hypothetical protein